MGRGSGTANAETALSWFNVLDYGARGDGTGDDSLPILTAINNAAALSSNWTVVLPAGTYAMASARTIPAGCTLVLMPGVTITGAGGFTVNGQLIDLTGAQLGVRGANGIAVKSATDATKLVQISHDGTNANISTTGNLNVAPGGLTNGQAYNDFALSENLIIAAAATSTTTIQIPAGGVVLGVSSRVTTVGVTSWPANFTVGDGTTAAKFNTGTNVSTALNTTDAGTKAGPTYYPAATSIVVTPSGTPGDVMGRIRLTIHGYTITPPTS